MKLAVAIHTLIAIITTLLVIWWLYPLNNGAIALVFIMANCISIIIVFAVRKLIKKSPE